MLLKLALLAALAAPAASHSEVRLISDVATIRAGEPFTVGLHITLDEGWRTPWKNAGDVGNGLIATWTLPDGFKADSFAYPIPERIANPPVTSYGYHNEVVILAKITPPSDLKAGRPVLLKLATDFVLCGHTCVPVRAERSLALPVRDASPLPSTDATLIRRYAERLPVASAEWQTRAARTGGGFVVDVVPPANWKGSLRGAYFFPAEAGLLDHAAEQLVARAAVGQYRIRLTESAYLNHEPKRIEGILVLAEGNTIDASGHRGLVISSVIN
jgi:thiol:disulfide interchange protein DsbD